MTAHLFKMIGAGVASASLLAACGGGGGSAAPATTTPATATFALSAGYQARIVSGKTDNFIVSGSCDGTAQIATSPAVATTFEGVAGFSAAQVSTITFSNTRCTTTKPQTNGTTYFNSSYVPIGLAIVGGEYSTNTGNASPATLPATVKVGDGGTIDTMSSYTDNTKAVTTGKRVLSYAIEADTSTTTAIANFITTSYDQAGNLLSTQQSRYHMAADGTLALASIDVQFAFTSTLHLVYTPQ
jgi:hypothetical protein